MKVTTFVVEDLCLHEDYVATLRRELQEQRDTRPGEMVDVDKLPLLESFIKESIRYTNTDAGEH